jgi:hypothetical protein
MATIVGVHGIAQQFKGPESLRLEWWPSLQDGITNARRSVGDAALACAFYGDLFRPAGRPRKGAETETTPASPELQRTNDEFDAALLKAIWTTAAREQPDRVMSPDAKVKMGAPNFVQRALLALAQSRFFVGITREAMLGNLKQVRQYMRDPYIRNAAQASVDAVVTEDTKVLLGHSLGSVAAYEALHRYGGTPRWQNVKTLITAGSPLGIPNLIFDELSPAPVNGRGIFPPSIERWTNISDDGDVVALEKKLAGVFDGGVVDIAISNGATAHDIKPYLTADDTGRAITDAL